MSRSQQVLHQKVRQSKQEISRRRCRLVSTLLEGRRGQQEMSRDQLPKKHALRNQTVNGIVNSFLYIKNHVRGISEIFIMVMRSLWKVWICSGLSHTQ